MAKTWIGRKKIAFIPVFRPNAQPPDIIPADWANQILQRVLFNPDPTIQADRSLRAYIRAASSGLADLDVVVMPMASIEVPNADVRLEILDQQLDGPGLQAQGFDAAAAVMLGGAGSGTAQTGGFWARFVMAETLGTWAMELMHVLTGFNDIRDLIPPYADSPNDEGDIGNFDEMAFSKGMHPTAYTKAGIKWLDGSAIAQHGDGAASYALHAVGLVQPPPTGRWAAVRIGQQVPYLMVEARLMVDQFESPSQLEPGIPSQGVIVYRVQTSDSLGFPQNNLIPIFLLTTTALAPGTAFTSDSDVTVLVTGALPGGFSVVIETPDPNAIPWTSVSEGRSTPGASITAVVTGPNRVTLFLADPNGGVYTTSGSASAGWAPWTSVSEGRSTPGAPITAVVTGPNRVTLFLADPNGGVYTTSGSASAGWAPWTNVSEGRSTPGAPITAVVTGPNRVTLFLADPNGGVYTTSGSASAGWAPWTSVSEGRSTPGAPITAAVTGPNRVTLFLADPNGGVYTTSGSASAGWAPWTSVSEGRSTPGALITAVVTGPDRVALFLADPNGGVYTIFGQRQRRLGAMGECIGGKKYARRTDHRGGDGSGPSRIVPGRSQRRGLHNLGQRQRRLGAMGECIGGQKHARRPDHRCGDGSEPSRIVPGRSQRRGLHNH